LVKGKPWDLEDEKKLTSWFRSGTTNLRVLAFSFDGKYTEEAIRQKLINLDLLKEQQQSKNVCCCSSELKLPEELPSIEETLKTLAAALESLKMPGLEKNDVFRLRCIITGAKVYKDLLSDYVNYRGLEAELLELREKYAEFSKKTQGVSPK
jgi:hypothetical protein